MSHPSGHHPRQRHPEPRATRLRSVRATGGIFAVSVLLTASSCASSETNGSDPTENVPTSTQASDPTPTDPTPSTATEPTTDEDKAAAALLGYLEIRDRAYATGRISKQLNSYATGQEHFGLQQFVTTLNNDAEAHFVGTWVHDVVRTERGDAEQYLVTDCEDGTDVDIVRNSGSDVLPWFKFDGKEVPRRLEQTYRVVLEKDRWKVQQKTSVASKVEAC